MRTIKLKVLLSYLSLLCILAFGGWFVYNEVQTYRLNDEETSTDEVVGQVNELLTQLYHAEGLFRAHQHSNYRQQYIKYKAKMDSVMFSIDSLSMIIENPLLKSDLDSIKSLLLIKQTNQQDLLLIQTPNGLDSLYAYALQKLNSQSDADSLAVNVEIIQNQTVYYDSTYLKHEVRENAKGLKRLFNIKETLIDSTLKVTVSKHLQVDSIINRVDANDSIAHLLIDIIEDIRRENSYALHQRRLKENKIVNNSIIISTQLRHLLANIEQQQFKDSYEQISAQKQHMSRARQILIFFGVLGLVAAIFFLINILKDLTQTQKYRRDLEEAKSKVEALLKNKEMMMLSLSHDLKSPINAIKGFIQLLNNETTSEVSKLYLQSISQSSNHIQNLVEDLLSLAKLEQGKLELHSQSFNLGDVLNDTVKTFSAETEARNLELNLWNNVNNQTLIHSDPVRLKQILNNLISNALKFTPKGKIDVTIDTLKETKNGINIRIIVSDTGIGIPDELQKSLFEPFNRGNVKDHQIEGTGLGLAITKRIVELLEGTIKIDSKVHEGSSFTVELFLPFAKDEANTNDTTTLLSQQNKCICLVDDDDTFLKMMTAVLRASGLKVKPYNCPIKALNNYADNSFDLLITDIQMPKMNGIELVKNVYEKDSDQLKTIAISGLDQLPAQANDLFNFILHKPFQPKDLLKCISKALDINEAVKDKRSTKKRKGLEKLIAFADGDKDQEREIITTFLENERNNIVMLERYINLVNVNGISNLAHKMLNIYRQLNADDIIELLIELENKDFEKHSRRDYFEIAKQTTIKIKTLIAQLESESTAITAK